MPPLFINHNPLRHVAGVVRNVALPDGCPVRSQRGRAHTGVGPRKKALGVLHNLLGLALHEEPDLVLDDVLPDQDPPQELLPLAR